MRIGMGYDVHCLVSGRELVLGGISIPYGKGLAGHSDADVLTHAICDALLGAANLGDIGLHFPDTDPEFADISSLRLLERSYAMVKEKGLALVNLDTTILAQAPRLSPYGEAMRDRLAQALGVGPDLVSIKATTTEGLGAVGRGEGIGAMAVVLLD